jgi:cysteine-rich repeat protein
LVLVAMLLAVATVHASPTRNRGELIFADGHHIAPRSLEMRELGDWKIAWDRAHNVAATIYGSHVDVPGSSADPAIAERAARAFITERLDILAPGGEFVVVANRLDGEIRSVGFEQRWHGSRVVGGQIGVVFSHDRLFALTSQAVPNVSAVPMKSRVRGERVVLGDRVVDRIRDGEWDIYLDDHGEVARQSNRREASGTLEYNAGVRYAAGTRSDVPAHTANLTANGAMTTTSATGTFTFSGANPASVTPTCTGTEVSVVNQAGTAATTTLSVPNGNAAIWNVANVEFDDAQVSTYVYGTIATERAKVLDPANVAWLDPFVFYVNEVDPCNAYSDADGVHLAKSVEGCENTGRVADIVFHEFGHSTHYHEIITGVGFFDLALAEGLADFNAANITEDSGIGRGLDFTDAAAREIDPVGIERVYPADINGDAHVTGEIISGALWDLRKALITELGHDPGVAATERVFVGVMRRASDLPTSYMAALIADDDNGDLGDGTPHFCAIQRAFGVHGLAPDFADTVIGAPTLTDFTIRVPVTAPTTGACPARNVVSMHVLWKIGDGVANDLDLAASTDAWTAAIPAQPDGTIVSYSVDVTLDDGTAIAYPDNPADPMYQVFIGTATPIWCENFDSDPQWMRSGTAPAEWQWARPNASGPESGDPATTYDGTFIYGTNLMGPGSYGLGEVTATTTPTIDTSSFQLIHLQYWRWLTVEDYQDDQAEITASNDTIWKNATNSQGTLAHVDREWRFHDVDLTPHLYYGSVAVTWQLTTNGSAELGGWNLDDVCIVGMQKLPVCGDHFIDLGEQCDDGNTFSGDGCSDKCQDEVEAAGGGGCCSADGGGVGSAMLAFVVGLCVKRRRRSSCSTAQIA